MTDNTLSSQDEYRNLDKLISNPQNGGWQPMLNGGYSTFCAGFSWDGGLLMPKEGGIPDGSL